MAKQIQGVYLVLPYRGRLNFNILDDIGVDLPSGSYIGDHISYPGTNMVNDSSFGTTQTYQLDNGSYLTLSYYGDGAYNNRYACTLYLKDGTGVASFSGSCIFNNFSLCYKTNEDGTATIGWIVEMGTASTTVGSYINWSPVADQGKYLWLTGSTFEDNDPYEGFEESTTGGGGGTGYRIGEDMGFPALPSLSAIDTGFVKLYKATVGQMKSLASFMWSEEFYNNIVKLWSSPMQAIIGLSILPVNPPTGSIQVVTVGNVETPVSMTALSSQYMEVDCGSLNVQNIFKSYLSYAPYTKISIMLPYIGCHDLNTDEIMGGNIHVKYFIDLLTGACICCVNCANGTTYQWSGNCACQIPITGENYAQVWSGILRSIAGGAATIASGGLTSPLLMNSIASAGSTVTSAKPDIMKSGALSSNVGLMGLQKPYLIIEEPNICRPGEQNKFTGYPSFINSRLGDLSGYTVVSEIHLDGIAATEEELGELDELLKSGVIIEQSEIPDTIEDIVLFKSLSDERTIGKKLEVVAEYTGTFRESVDLLNPTFNISANSIPECNYVYIRSFNRFYYITSKVSQNKGVFRFSCKVDVLQTYLSELLELRAIIGKQENQYNLYLNDGTFKIYQNPKITCHSFPYGFSTENFILAVAGD